MSEGQMNQHLASCLTGNDNVTSPVPVCVLGFCRNSLSARQKNGFRIKKKIFRHEAFSIQTSPNLQPRGRGGEPMVVFPPGWFLVACNSAFICPSCSCFLLPRSFRLSSVVVRGCLTNRTFTPLLREGRSCVTVHVRSLPLPAPA